MEIIRRILGLVNLTLESKWKCILASDRNQQKLSFKTGHKQKAMNGKILNKNKNFPFLSLSLSLLNGVAFFSLV
jgi:hypothetical protein